MNLYGEVPTFTIKKLKHAFILPNPTKIFNDYIASIYKNNSRPTTVRGGRAIYLLASRLNHSCTPNIHLHTHTANDVTFNIGYTLRDIDPGEELTVAYTPVDRSVAARSQRLDFDCACRTCDDKYLASHVSESRRSRLQLLKSVCEDPDAELRAVVAAATETTNLLMTEGLLGPELAAAHKTVAVAMFQQGNRARAKVAKSKEVQVLKTCFGEGHEKVKIAEKELAKLGRIG